MDRVQRPGDSMPSQLIIHVYTEAVARNAFLLSSLIPITGPLTVECIKSNTSLYSSRV
jgi:hypothetical protein